jgi:hypothetical protein
MVKEKHFSSEYVYNNNNKSIPGATRFSEK